MSLRDLQLDAIEADIAANRLLFSAAADALALRLRPASIVNTAIDKIVGKAGRVADEALQAAKANSGKAALFGAGSLLAFGLGRKVSGPKPVDLADGTGEASENAKFTGNPGVRGVRNVRTLRELPSTLKYWSGAATAVLAGYGLGRVVPISAAEEEMLGEVPAQIRQATRAFWREHAEGAKRAAAGSLGFAAAAASGLILMASFAAIFSKPSQPGGGTP